MKLSEWAHVAEVIGGIAIVASLLFVGMEVRENTQVTTLTLDRAVDQQNLALNLSLAESPDLAEIVVRAEMNRGSLTDPERTRFDNYCYSRFGAFENIVGDFSSGYVAKEELEVWIEYFNVRFNKPGYRQFWVENRMGFFPTFRAWTDERYGIAPEANL